MELVEVLWNTVISNKPMTDLSGRSVASPAPKPAR